MSEDNDELRAEGVKALQDLQEESETSEEETVTQEEGAGEELEAEEELDPEIVDVDPVQEPAVLAPEPTPEEAEEIRKKQKARFAQVLTRGLLNERLRVVVEDGTPAGRKGKLVLDAKDKILQYENLGYEFNYREGATGLNATSDGRIRVGDLVLMTVSDEDYSILDEIRTEKVKQKLSMARDEYHRRAGEAGQEEGVSEDRSVTQVVSSRG